MKYFFKSEVSNYVPKKSHLLAKSDLDILSEFSHRDTGNMESWGIKPCTASEKLYTSELLVCLFTTALYLILLSFIYTASLTKDIHKAALQCGYRSPSLLSKLEAIMTIEKASNHFLNDEDRGIINRYSFRTVYNNVI